MIETKEKVIDGATYSVTQLPARRALKLKAKLFRMFGPLFITSDANNLQALCNSLDENKIESLVLEMLQQVRKNGQELTESTFDMEFAGDMAGVYKVLIFVIEVNYGNFFSMLNIGLPSFGEKQTEQAPSTKKTYTRT